MLRPKNELAGEVLNNNMAQSSLIGLWTCNFVSVFHYCSRPQAKHFYNMRQFDALFVTFTTKS